jgi:beta-phosphoglucomutase-like phosphatase (HAD superfamily)
MDKRISTIIFDLDGVIVDSEPLHFEAHKKALEKLDDRRRFFIK